MRPTDFADNDFMPAVGELGAGEIDEINTRNTKDKKRDDNKCINLFDISAWLQIAGVSGIR